MEEEEGEKEEEGAERGGGGGVEGAENHNNLYGDLTKPNAR